MGIVASLLALLWCPWDGQPRIEQWHGLILGAGWLVCWRPRPLPRFGWGLGLWVALTAILWRDSYGVSWLWLATWLLVLASLDTLTPDEVVRAVVVVSWVELAVVATQALGWTHYPQIGSGWTGSVGRRYLLAALWALASLWSRGRWAWWWAGCSIATGSWMGLVALARLGGRWRWSGLVVVLATAPWWWSRVVLRMPIWWDGLTIGFAPVGFGKLTGGFLGQGMLDRLLGWSDYHCVPLELWARFGWWGVVGIIAALWVYRQLRPWEALWLIAVACLQSLEAYPALGWLMVLLYQGGRDGVAEV